MNQKVIRYIAIAVIICCVFATGIGIGVIAQSIEVIRRNAADFQDYAGTAEFFMGIGGDGSKTDYDRADKDEETLFAPFWEAWNLLHLYFVDQPLDDNALMEGAIRGMISALEDPHTRYSDPQQYKEEIESSAGEYQGIGAYVDVSGEYVRITSPIPGSPAEEAGLRTDDLVIGINGEDVTGKDPNEVLLDIRGPEGTPVLLTIRRGEDEPFDVEVIRRKIETASVEGEMLESGIAYVSMSQFGDNTTRELRDTLDSLMKQKPQGLILDLRNNGGGYLTGAVETASEFLPVGTTVLIEKEGDGTETVYKTERGGGRALDVPMVILINGGTASASEIVTGALRCAGRAEVIGTTSYGKGSVQIQPRLKNGGAVSVTIARWYMPDDTLIHGIGIEPDITVEYTEEDHNADKDPQLDAAVAFLTGTLDETRAETGAETIENTEE